MERDSDSVEEKTFELVVEGERAGVHPRVKKVVPKGKTSGWKYISLAGELGFDIALPMVLGLIVGTKLDARWGTTPKATAGLFVAGCILSCTSLIRIVKDVMRKG